MPDSQPSDCLVFLGSGGARVVVAKQVRASGGIWFSLAGTEFLVDPGPGALVRMTSSRHKLDPTRLQGILLSHRHLDHSGDVNNMIEAMTVGGTQPHGTVFAPSDALGGDDPVVLRYVREFLDAVVVLEEKHEYRIGNVDFACPIRHRHRGEVYGFRFRVPGLSISYIADTGFFPELADAYRADVVLLNVVRFKPSQLDHLHAPEAERLIQEMKPKLAILTHFGMTMIRARPWRVAEEMTQRTGVKVLAASDGRKVELAGFLSAPTVNKAQDADCETQQAGAEPTISDTESRAS